MHVPKEKRRKLDAKAKKCMLVTYSDAMCVEYVDVDNRRFIISVTASRIDHQM